MGREVVLVRIPESVNKVIKSTNTRGVAKLKTIKNSIKGIDFKLCGPLREVTLKSSDKR